MGGVERAGAAGIAFERRGEGPPLVLIHGLGATRAIWRPQLARLAAERDVIALDMPGFGASPPLAGAASPAALGEAISDALAGLGVERPHLAGNSLGGWVALEMARAGNAASLCLISPAGLWRRTLGPRRRDTHRWGQRLRPLVALAARSPRARAAMLRSTVGHPDRIPAAEARALIAAWIAAPGYAAADAEMRAARCADPGLIDVPTTIAWGELDRLVGPPKPERRPPGTRFIRLEGCGHTPNWDEPDLLADLILAAGRQDAAIGSGVAPDPRRGAKTC